MDTSKSTNPFFRILMVLFALTVMPIYEYGKKVSKHAYDGIVRAICNGFIGIGLASFASFLTAKSLGWDLEYNFFVWFMAAFLSWPLTFFVAWPTVYLVAVKPLFDVFEALFKWTEKLAEKQLKALFSGLVSCIKVLPGAGNLWSYVEDEKKGYKWVTNVVTFLAGASFVGFAAYVAYTTYTFALPFVSFSNPYFLSELAAGLIAIIPTVVAAVIPLQLLEKNKLHVAAITASGATTYGLFPVIASTTASLGLTSTFLFGTVPLTFILLLGFGYPAVHGILKSGLFAKLLGKVKYLIEQTYDEDDKKYESFYTHVVNIKLALAIGAVVTVFGAPIYPFIPAPALYGLAAILIVAAYIGLGEFLEDSPVNVFAGLASSALAGWYFHSSFADGLGTFALWSSIGGIAIAMFFLVFPLGYILGRFITNPWLAHPVGGLLDGAHNKASKLARRVSKWWEEKVYDKTYAEDSDYTKLFGHVANLCLLGLGIWQAIPLATGWLGMPVWLTAIGLAVLGYLTYLILGKLLTGIGPISIGFGLSVAAGLFVGYELYGVNASYWWLATLIGASAFGLSLSIVFPLAFLLVKLVANPLLTGWLTPILEGVYNFFWKRFEGIWKRFVAVYEVVYRNFFKPAIDFFARLIASAKAWWDEFRGRAK